MSSSVEVGRSAGSLTSAVATKSTNVSEKRSGFSSCGGAPLAIAKSTLSTGCISWCGGWHCAISIAVTPSDHTSARASYLPFWMTSGAIQCGVPMTELRLDAVELSCAATPKSASLTRPSLLKRMFALLMSRWMMTRFGICVCM